MAKKQLKSTAIAEKIAALQAELAETKRAEAEATDAELIRLVHKAGMTDEVIRQARQRIDQGARSKAS